MDQIEKIADYLGLRTEDISVLANGEYNRNYSFIDPLSKEKRVFRLNTGSQMHLEDQIGYEAHALKCLEGSGRTPKVYHVDGSKRAFSGGILVMEYLKGEPLDYTSQQDMANAVHILADIHSVPVPSTCGLLKSEYPLKEILSECEEMFNVYRTSAMADTTITERISSMLKKGWGMAEDISKEHIPLSIINTELNSGNFLMNKEGRSYLIDWEKPLIGDPAQDLGHFLAPTTTFWKTDVILSDREMDAFIRAYYEAAEKRESFETLYSRVHVYIPVTCLRGLTWSAMAWIEYQNKDKAVYNADTWEKLNVYLSDAFLTKIEERYFDIR